MDFLRHLTSPDELIRWGGYAGLALIIFAENGLLAGFFLPGDSLLVLAGIFAARGLFNVWFLCVLLTLAAIVGEMSGYYIGYSAGKKLFIREDSFLFSKKHLIRAKKFYDAYGGITIILARFIPLIRTFAPVAAGIGQMNYPKFFLFNVVGGMGWVWSMTFVGYLLGTTIPGVENHLEIVLTAIIVLSLLPIAIKYLKGRYGRTAPANPESQSGTSGRNGF